MPALTAVSAGHGVPSAGTHHQLDDKGCPLVLGTKGPGRHSLAFKSTVTVGAACKFKPLILGQIQTAADTVNHLPGLPSIASRVHDVSDRLGGQSWLRSGHE